MLIALILEILNVLLAEYMAKRHKIDYEKARERQWGGGAIIIFVFVVISDLLANLQ